MSISKKLFVVANGFSKSGTHLCGDSFAQVYTMALNIKRHLENIGDSTITIIASRKAVSMPVARYINSEIESKVVLYENSFKTLLKKTLEISDIVIIVIPSNDVFVNESVNCFLRTVNRTDAPLFSLSQNQRISGDTTLVVNEDGSIDWIKNQ